MAKRITIMLPDDLNKSIRQIQAKVIKERGTTYSFSSALADVLRKGLKK